MIQAQSHRLFHFLKPRCYRGAGVLAASIGDNWSLPRYTMRLCWTGEVPDDYQFFVDGKAAGCCYLMRAANNREGWRWTCTAFRATG